MARAGTRTDLRCYLRRLGPGFVTGAANDDPGAIGTHAQVGARHGLDGLRLALSLLGYVVAVFLVPQDWDAVLHATLVPVLSLDATHLLGIVAMIGTRVSPYVIVWQPAQVVEEDMNAGRTLIEQRVGATGREVRATQLDVIAGSFVATSWRGRS